VQPWGEAFLFSGGIFMLANFSRALPRVRTTVGKSLRISYWLLGTLLIAISASAFQYDPAAAVTPSALDFPAQAVGTTSAPMIVTLTNNGDSDMRVTSVRFVTSQFSWFGPALPIRLSPGQSLSGTVTFTPSSAGQVVDQLTFRLGAEFMTSAPLSGTGVSPGALGQSSTGQSAPIPVPPTIESNPVSQTVIAGQSATFSVAATGDAPLSYQWLMNGAPVSGATSPFFVISATTTANSGATFAVVVSNDAGSVTSSTATLTVNPGGGMLAASPSSLSFGGLAIGGSLAQTVTLTNIGNASVTVYNVSVSGAGFTPSGLTIGQILAPGSSATMLVVFLPLLNLNTNGSVTITSNANNSPLTISLSGGGTQSGSHSVTLTWTPSATSTVIGYNVYRSSYSGGESQSGPINGTALVYGASFVDTNVAAGATYYYAVTAVDSSGVESADSTEVSAAIPSQ
jgi:hypothetical protein